MNTGQIQIRLGLTDQLYQFLIGQSSRLGIPVTQVVKHMIIEKAQQEKYPIYQASVQTETAYREAMANIGKAIKINNRKGLKKFFDSP
mgnify:CR=1 FL=1